jgi:translocation and assembly module TamB
VNTRMSSRNAKLLMLGGLLSGICFLIGLLGASQLPKVRSWILVQIEDQTREHLPVRILPTSVDVDFLPLGTTLHGVRIFPKDEMKAFLDPLEIKRVSVTISLWQLLQGKLRLSSVEVEGTQLSVRIPKTEKKSKEKPLDGLFQALDKIPVSRLRVEDVSVAAQLADPKMNITLDAVDFESEKVRGGFSLALEHATARIQDPVSNANVLLDIEADISASPQRVVVESLKIRRGDSFFTASGRGSGDIEALELKEYELAVRSELVLDSMRNWITKTFANEKWTKKLPQFKGRLFVDGRIKRPHGKPPSGDFAAHAEGFTVDKIALGHLETEGTYKNDLIKFPKLTLTNPATSSVAENITIDFKKEPDGASRIGIEGHVKVPALNLNELLFQFGVGRIPVYASVSGEAPCKGTLRPDFALDCKAVVSAKDVLVEDGTDKKKMTIVRVPQANGTGDIHINEEGISYKADLTMPDSKGRSDGVIGFETGFKINFEGDRVSFKDVANLANLKIEGVAHIKGTTEGTSKVGRVSLNLDGGDVWFEDFWLGNIKGGVSYAASQLKFSDITGNAAVSRYSGDVTLDLREKQITVNGRFPFFDARDLLKIFSRRVQLPFPVLGTGQGTIKANGPLDLGHLSYDLRTSLFRGSVAGESFDQAHFDVKSNRGEVKAERVQVAKGPALITLTGVAHPDGKIETTIHGRGLRLEDTNTIARSGIAVSGGIDFEMLMNGPVLAPETDMKGTLTRTSIGDQAVPDSDFRLKFTKSAIEGGGKFLGDVVNGEFIIPLNSEAPFKIKASTKDWNFAPLFAAIAGPASRKDYEGNLTTSIDLSSPNGGFWNSTGDVKISKFVLSRGTLKLQNPKPMQMTMKNGQLGAHDVSLSGDSIFLNVQEPANPTSKLDLMVNGKIDLGLLALMTPFFEDLRGLLSFKLQVKGGNVPNNFVGSAYLEKGYIKFFDFPHAFEDIRADLLFNQQKILFNSIRSEFGGGRISANGGMEIKGYKDTPLNVSGTFEKITLNVPDKMQTSGSGDFSVTGNGFPFLLKGTYNVSDGSITKSFGGDNAEAYALSRRDAYLPDFLVQENFIPMVVDMTIDLSKGVAVKNDLVDGRTLGSLTIKGNPTKPAIGGSLTTDKESKVFFRNSTFDIVSANVQFNGTSEIDPKLYVSARTRIDPYDVSLLVQGTGSKPELLLSSTPQLPEKDIVSLLAFGATDTNLDKSVKSQQQSSNIGSIGASGIVQHNPISEAIKERLGFDVQFTTGFDDTNTSVQKIVATRQLGQKLTFSTGYSYGNAQSAEARIRYRLNDRLSLIGAYQENNSTEVNVEQSQIESQPNVFGLDMEYKLEFK